MLAVTVTDKNGTKRRAQFEEHVVTIGRIRGNELILPKGNISKRHATIRVEGDQMIVEDLNSTNGTYVNGKKITGPHILKSTDKIYVGDFTITVQLGASLPAQTQAGASGTPSVKPIASEPPSHADSQADASSEQDEHLNESAPPAPVTESPAPAFDQITGEQQPFDDAKDHSSSLSKTQAPAILDNLMLSPVERVLARAGRRFDIHDVSAAALQSKERWSNAQTFIVEAVKEMHAARELDEVDNPNALADAALHEAVGLGPLDELLSDTSVHEITVFGPDRIFVDRGNGLEESGAKFSGAQSLETTIGRLASQTGKKLSTAQPVFVGQLSFGPTVRVLRPPLVESGPVLEIRCASNKNLDELASAGWMQETQANLLRLAVQHEQTVLVVGARGSGVTTLISALAQEIRGEPIALVEDLPSISVQHTPIVRFARTHPGRNAQEIIGQASLLRASRLIIDGLTAADFSSALDALSTRASGSVLGLHLNIRDERGGRIAVAIGHVLGRDNDLAHRISQIVDVVAVLKRDKGTPQLVQLERTRAEAP